MSQPDRYTQWIAGRRGIRPPAKFADDVMAAIDGETYAATVETHSASWLAKTSPLAAAAACCVAFFIGMTPFVIAAYLAHSVAF